MRNKNEENKLKAFCKDQFKQEPIIYHISVDSQIQTILDKIVKKYRQNFIIVAEHFHHKEEEFFDGKKIQFYSIQGEFHALMRTFVSTYLFAVQECCYYTIYQYIDIIRMKNYDDFKKAKKIKKINSVLMSALLIAIAFILIKIPV